MLHSTLCWHSVAEYVASAPCVESDGAVDYSASSSVGVTAPHDTLDTAPFRSHQKLPISNGMRVRLFPSPCHSSAKWSQDLLDFFPKWKTLYRLSPKRSLFPELFMFKEEWSKTLLACAQTWNSSCLDSFLLAILSVSGWHSNPTHFLQTKPFTAICISTEFLFIHWYTFVT